MIDDSLSRHIWKFMATGKPIHGGSDLSWFVDCEDGERYKMTLTRTHECNVQEESERMFAKTLAEIFDIRVGGMITADQERARAVLGAMVLMPSTRENIRELLTGREFSSRIHRQLWRAITEVEAQGDDIDLGVIRAHVLEGGGDGREALEEIGQCTNAVYTGNPTMAMEYARAVHRAHAQQTLADTLAMASESVRGASRESVVDIIESIRPVMDGTSESMGSGSRAVNMADMVTDEIVGIVEHSQPPMLPTGIQEFDHRFGGLGRTFVILAGYPGMGKSTLLANIATNVALAGKTVLIMSMEDTARVIFGRILARLAEVDVGHVLRRCPTDEESGRIVQTEATMRKLKIVVDEKAGRDSTSIRADVMRHMHDHDVDLVMVDHLGKVRDKGGSLYEKVTAASGAIADLQREIGIPLVAACQMKRRDKTQRIAMPQIDDLRDSGHIEADARQIVLLHRPYYYYQTRLIDEPPPANEINLVVGKNNYGQTGVLKAYVNLSQSYIGDPPVEGY